MSEVIELKNPVNRKRFRLGALIDCQKCGASLSDFEIEDGERLCNLCLFLDVIREIKESKQKDEHGCTIEILEEGRNV